MIFRADNALFVVLIALLGFAHGRDPPVEADQDATDRALPEQRLMPVKTAFKRIRCESHVDFEYNECHAGGKVKRITIHRQLTGSKDCIRGTTYGSIKDRVWVSSGCMAVFIVLLDGEKLKQEGEMCGKPRGSNGPDHGECDVDLYCVPEFAPSHHRGTCIRLFRGVAKKDICKLPRQKGHRCYAAMPRVYFDQVSGKCKKFTFGGCGATENNFLTRNACEKKCGGSLLSGRPTETGTSFPLGTRG